MQDRKTQKWDLCVLGLGHVGLPTALLFADKGLNVCAVDSDQDVLNAIKNGKPIGAENVVQSLTNKLIRKKNLFFHEKAQKSQNYIIAVPTPVAEDRSPDLSMVHKAFDEITPLLEKGDLVIIESTCPIGTTKTLAERLQSQRKDLYIAGKSCDPSDVSFSYCPERVLPGDALNENIQNTRIIGYWGEGAGERAAGFYRHICLRRMTITDASTAELSKLVVNAFRDVNVGFANEIDMLATKHGISFEELRSIVNCHPRVSMLHAGAGVGGHSVPVDPWFLIHDAPEETEILKAARTSNFKKERFTADIISKYIADYEIKTLGIYGLSYKPETSDLKESPSIRILEALLDRHRDLLIMSFDPFLSKDQISRMAFTQNPRVSWAGNTQTLNQECNLIVVLTAHDSVKPMLRNKSTVNNCPHWLDLSGQNLKLSRFKSQPRFEKNN